MTSNRKVPLMVVDTELELRRQVKTKYRDMTTDGFIYSFICPISSVPGTVLSARNL